MTPPPAGPRCPRCQRPLAAWKMKTCVYCGEAIPDELKQGFEPEGLKWIERPALPTDLSKKLEVMRITTAQPARKSRLAMAIGAGLLAPVILAGFYIAYVLIRQLSPVSAVIVLIAGIGGGAYLLVSFLRNRAQAQPAVPPAPPPRVGPARPR